VPVWLQRMELREVPLSLAELVPTLPMVPCLADVSLQTDWCGFERCNAFRE